MVVFPIKTDSGPILVKRHLACEKTNFIFVHQIWKKSPFHHALGVLCFASLEGDIIACK